MEKMATILIADDERGVRESFRMVLKDKYNLLLACDGEEAIEMLTENPVDLILLDIRLPDIDGITLLKKFKEMDPNVEIIMVTAVKEIQTAVKAIKLGAYEYVIKPFSVNDVLTLIKRALEKQNLLREVTYLKTELERFQPFEKMVGKDEKMRAIYELVSTISGSDGAVLIEGESGTGKELVARAIHNLSYRKEQPFVVINCAAIPSSLVESEIFGHQKGAFTGAICTTLGKLEIANNGTVFLDDIDTFDISIQAKLLRVIQEKEFERIGSNKIIKINNRFVAASNKDLKELISKGRFREDLFYRLNVFPISLPPLRKRRGDIPLLLNHFLDIQARNTGRPRKKFSEKFIKLLIEWDWPGNVRELENLVERLFTIIKKRVIHVEDIAHFNIVEQKNKNMMLKEAVNAFEKQYVYDVLTSVNGNRKRASEILGIHRNTLLSKINEFGLNKKSI